MHHFFEAITNTEGKSLIGYFARVINPTTQALVTIYSDNAGTPISVVSGQANAAKTDDFGNLSLYVDPGTYHLDLYGPDATTFLFRVSNVAMNSTKGDKGDPGQQGDTGPANSTYLTLASLKAAPVTNRSYNFAPPSGADGGTAAGPFLYQTAGAPYTADDVNVVKLDAVPLSTGALVRQPAAGVNFDGRSTDAKLRETISVKDARMAGGAKGDGVANDTAPLLAAAVAARIGMTDGLRTFAGEVKLPPGRYRIQDIVDLAPAAGVAGLTVSGAGDGSTEIVFTNSAATIKCTGSRSITFRDVTFRSLDPTVDGPVTPYGVDMNQTAFTIQQTSSPLRSWRFERCTFAGFYKCFTVTGSSLCSEFFFDKCTFAQCYTLMDNSNDQAVNWNFVNCNWENEALDTTKDKNAAAAFMLQAGTHVTWTGGSLIFWGRLAYFNLTAGNRVQSTSHALTFDGVRVELVDGGAGSHVPFFDRVEAGYVTGGNSPVVSMLNSTIINRGAIPATTVYAKLWNNCNFTFDNCQMEGGRVVGILDGLTTTANGTLRILNTARLDYVEDTTSRASDHDAHAVTIVPPFNGAEGAMMADVRPSSLAAPASVSAKYVTVRGPTGSLPLGGTTVNLDDLPVHSTSLRLFIHSYDLPGASLQMELRNQSDTTSYGSVTLASGSKIAWADAPGEIGFQIPAVPLMLKFTGTPQVLKGICGWEYL